MPPPVAARASTAAGTGAGTGAGISATASSSVWTYFSPRSQEAAAATSDMTTAALKTMRSPCMKGSEMSWGKKVLPVM